jgi:hypothetical protein
MLATDLKTDLEKLNAEPLVIKAVIASADPGAKDAQLRQQEMEIAGLRSLIPSEQSLKVRATRTADELVTFWKTRPKQPVCTQTSKMTPAEQQAAITPCTQYQMVVMQQYSEQFAPAIMAMVEEFRAKGISVRDIEHCVPDGFCGIAISVQLKAMAARLDAKDNVKR